jgi:hypothetical protein
MLTAIATTLILSAYTKPVTALAAYDGSLFVGRADGAVERVGRDLQVTAQYAKAGGKPVSFVTASAYGVAWLAGPGGVVREKVAVPKPGSQTLSIRTGERTFAVAIQPQSTVRRLSWIGGRVAVSYDFGSAFYDTGAHPIAASSFMPADVAALAANSSLWVRQQEDGTELALFARPHSVRQDPRNQNAPLVSLFTAYQIGAWQWEKLGGFASNAFDAFPDGELKATEEGKLAGDAKFLVLSDRVALAEDGIVAREPDALVNAPIYTRNWEIGRQTACSIPGDGLWMGVAGDDAWWWNGVSLVQQNRRSGQFAAYLPWSDPGMVPSCFAADDEGLWIGSNHGLRLLDPAKPDEKLGYAGFVRAPFGSAAASTTDLTAKKLSDAVFAWRFAEAEKAGADGGLMVASIYSTLGLQLPQTAPGLMESGVAVGDELRFGDVLLTEKSAAVYLGNGVTVEVRGGRVQNGELWAFPRALVRRFTNPPLTTP